MKSFAMCLGLMVIILSACRDVMVEGASSGSTSGGEGGTTASSTITTAMTSGSGGTDGGGLTSVVLMAQCPSEWPACQALTVYDVDSWEQPGAGNALDSFKKVYPMTQLLDGSWKAVFPLQVFPAHVMVSYNIPSGKVWEPFAKSISDGYCVAPTMLTAVFLDTAESIPVTIEPKLPFSCVLQVGP